MYMRNFYKLDCNVVSCLCIAIFLQTGKYVYWTTYTIDDGNSHNTVELGQKPWAKQTQIIFKEMNVEISRDTIHSGKVH